MFKLLKFIFLGHSHKWEILEKGKSNNYATYSKNVVDKRIFYILKCSKCVNIKNVQIGADDV